LQPLEVFTFEGKTRALSVWRDDLSVVNSLWRTELMKWLTILYPSYQEYPKHHRHCSRVHLLPNEASCEDFKWKRFTLRHCNWWSKSVKFLSESPHRVLVVNPANVVQKQ
jgi:hypothetical protein